MKRILDFLARLVIVSIPVVWITPKLDLAFRYLQVLLVSHQHPTDDLMKPLFYVSASKLIPFFLLILATPKLSLPRRAGAIAAAVALYFLTDLAMVAVWQVAPFQTPDPSPAHVVSSYVWDMLGRWLLPFLFWLVAAHRTLEDFFCSEKHDSIDGEGRVPAWDRQGGGNEN